MYAKDLNEPNYQFLNKKREDVGIKHLKDPKAFIEYSGHMEHAYNSIINYNPNRSNSMQFSLNSIHVMSHYFLLSKASTNSLYLIFLTRANFLLVTSY